MSPALTGVMEEAERTLGKPSENREAKVMGIDLAKSSFHVHGMDASGRKVVGKKLSRQKLKEYLVNLPQCTVAMEACAGAHYWARQLHSYGHEVRLIAPQFVKPYVKSNKNDAADAEAICEAAQRPRFEDCFWSTASRSRQAGLSCSSAYPRSWKMQRTA